MAEICVTIARRRHQKLLEEMDAARAQGARMMEIRLDFLAREPRLDEILKRRSCPLVATIRRKKDGGQWTESEEKRLLLLRSAIVAGFDYVDIEWDVADKIPRYGSTKRILSHHDMQQMPSDLGKLHRTMVERDADIVKIAAKANDPAENFAMLRLVADAKVPTVAFCMGDLGTLSRIAGAKLGSPYTYAAFNPERIVAPGLLTLAEMRELYRYESINAETGIYGVIGDPIAQSLSPLVHNTCFQELGLNKVYVPIRIPVECLDRFLAGMGSIPVEGLSVTIPHKQNILPFGQISDPLVRATGSANTMIRVGDKYELFNTDGPAAMQSLEAALPIDRRTGKRSLKDRAVVVLGAGGVARTIAHSLQAAGALVTITNRTYERATELARDVGCSALEWNQRHLRQWDIVINCTKLGMYPEVEKTPFHGGSIREKMVVFDTVYNPENTALLQAAKEHDAIVVSGVSMFVAQAEAQFRRFAGQDPPRGMMETLVREELSPARNMLRQVRLSSGKKT
ncbi:MAG: shikimate dehydrogenase [Planctomycetota bacterium]